MGSAWAQRRRECTQIPGEFSVPPGPSRHTSRIEWPDAHSSQLRRVREPVRQSKSGLQNKNVSYSCLLLCVTRARQELNTGGDRAHGAHELPHAHCTCGVYAAKNIEHLRQFGYDGRGIHGEVYLWGTVVEHRLGWRAQFAYPKSLFLPPDAIPFTLTEMSARLKTLIAFGTDIFIVGDNGSICLWKNSPGFDAAGLDHIIKAREEYYVRPPTRAHPNKGRPRGSARSRNRSGRASWRRGGSGRVVEQARAEDCPQKHRPESAQHALGVRSQRRLR